MAGKVMTEDHLKFLQSRGYCKPDAEGKGGTVEDAQKFFDAMNDREKKGFLADFAVNVTNKPPAAEAPSAGQSQARSAEEREGKEAKQYLVKRHLMHNEKLYKSGTKMSEEQFTPEQIHALLGTKTIEEIAEEEAEK